MRVEFERVSIDDLSSIDECNLQEGVDDICELVGLLVDVDNAFVKPLLELGIYVDGFAE